MLSLPSEVWRDAMTLGPCDRPFARQPESAMAARMKLMRNFVLAQPVLKDPLSLLTLHIDFPKQIASFLRLTANGEPVGVVEIGARQVENVILCCSHHIPALTQCVFSRDALYMVRFK